MNNHFERRFKLKVFPEISLIMGTLVSQPFSYICLTEYMNRASLPSIWSTAIVAPILKPGKPKTSPNSYRPIALTCTNTMRKIFEKMITTRLVQFLDANSIIDPFQAGFRRGRSTLDHLAHLEAEIHTLSFST